MGPIDDLFALARADDSAPLTRAHQLGAVTILTVHVAAVLLCVVCAVATKTAWTAAHTHAPARVFRLDDRTGWALVPNSADDDRTPLYTTTYTIDGEGHRRTPAPIHPRATIAILGDSFMFGDGVRDDETTAAYLAGAWPDVRVVNAAVSGWGLTQMTVAAMETVAHPHPPDAIVVVLIPDDLHRTELSPPLSPFLRRWEWIGGQFVTRAPSTIRQRLTHVAEERQRSHALIGLIAHAAQRAHVPIAMILLTDLTGAVYDPAFLTGMTQAGLLVVNLTTLHVDHWNDGYGHPTAIGDRAIAAAIAASPVRALVRR